MQIQIKVLRFISIDTVICVSFIIHGCIHLLCSHKKNIRKEDNQSGFCLELFVHEACFK